MALICLMYMSHEIRGPFLIQLFLFKKILEKYFVMLNKETIPGYLM